MITGFFLAASFHFLPGGRMSISGMCEDSSSLVIYIATVSLAWIIGPVSIHRKKSEVLPDYEKTVRRTRFADDLRTVLATQGQ
jgi:hypothetical protein